jgi:hypothetical protein
MRFRIIGCVAALAFCAGLVVPPVHAEQELRTDRNGYAVSIVQHDVRVLMAAGGNPAVCKANWEQCYNACDGATGCQNQCSTNYSKCLGQ